MPISNKLEILPLATRLDDQIAELQSSLANIKKQKTLLDEAINEHRALLTPFRQLPDDILGETFIWCLPDDRNAVMSALEPPLLLGRVCSRWRSLAYNSPRLWTTLQVFSPTPPPEHQWNSQVSWVPEEERQQLIADFDCSYANLCDAVQDWLNRSRHLPLSLSIDFRINVSALSTLYQKHTDAFFRILISSSHRWRSLELCMLPRIYPTFLPSLQPDSLASLEFLHITFGPRLVSSYLNYWRDSGLLRSQNLRVLHLARNPFRLSDLGIAWTQITHLILGVAESAQTRGSMLDTIKVPQFYTILKDCQRLEHCTLEVCDDPISSFHPPEILFLPSLSSLALMDKATCLGDMLQYIQVPALREVTYYTRSSPSATWRSPLLLLLRQSNSNVQSLTSSFDFFTVNDLVECFSLVPHLRHLKNWYHWPPGKASTEQKYWRVVEKPFQAKMMKTILDLLLPNSFNLAYPCPHLQTLTLTQSFGLTDRDALNFLQQRLDASLSRGTEVRRLDKVDISFDNPITIDIRAHLQSYVDEGMELNLFYPPTFPTVNHSGSFNPIHGLIVGSEIPGRFR